MAIYRHYVVTLKNKSDLEQFYQDMETEGQFEFAPSRSVECVHKRNISRNTHYRLTNAEAEILRQDPRVQGVELDIQETNLVNELHAVQTGTFSRATEPTIGQRNWGLYRSVLRTNPENWGSETSLTEKTASVNFTETGLDVDVVVLDDIAYPTHFEINGKLTQYDWYANHDAAVRGAAVSITNVERDSSNRATVTTNGAHSLAVGMIVTVTCTSDATYNATDVEITAVSASINGGIVDKFRYANTGSQENTKSATGTWVGKYKYYTTTPGDSYTGANNHATHVAGIIAGENQGWAKDANLFNLRHDTANYDLNPSSANQYTPLGYVIDYLRAWHNNKGNSNPTIVNCSWGLGTRIIGKNNPYTGNIKSRFSEIRYQGQTITPQSLGNPEVDTGYSGVCSATARLATLQSIVNGGNRIATVSGSATVDTLAKNILGRTGMTLVGAPTGSSPTGVDEYDDAAWQISLPFDISYLGTTYGPSQIGADPNLGTIWISSNSFVLFGGSAAGCYTVTVGAEGPAARKIHVSAGDRSCQRIYTQTSGTTPNRTFRVRWEGHDAANGGVDDAPTVVWEMTFYESSGSGSGVTNATVDLHIDQNSNYRGEFTTQQLLSYGVNINYNNSPQRNAAFEADMDDAILDGIIFVCSAGNDAHKIDLPGGQDYDNYFVDNGIPYYYHRGSTPGAHPDVICVGALSSSSAEYKMQASNTGPRVDIYAPGMNVISGVYDGSGDSGPTSSATTVVENGSTYQKYNGSSMATAQVTGYLALVLEKYPAFTQSQINTYLLSHATFGKMFETYDGYNDVTSLQDGNNLILYYFKDRAEQGTVFPSYALGARPTDGQTYPRVKIRRT